MHVIPHPLTLRNCIKGWVPRPVWNMTVTKPADGTDNIFVMHITRTHTYTVSSVGTGRAGTDFREHYLGPLYPSEQYKMYEKNICMFIY